ncbi:MAG TPA: ABC transporter permease [Solirubrobacteraceae bacterium]|nr:ABC transporter permease [Solirubrobacteraceae bacterium]
MILVHALQFIARNGQLPGESGLPTLVHLTLVTIKIAGLAVLISIVVGLPVGVILGHLHRGSFVAINLGNLWRSLPSLAVLAIGAAFLGLGLNVVLFALIVLAVPPIITNAYVAVDEVDRDLVDAARGMGMTERQILLQIELPLAVPLIMAGVRTGALFVVSTTTIASLAGYSGTLGDIIVNETSYQRSGVLGAAICIAGLALTVDALLAGAQWTLTPRALRRRGDGREAVRSLTALVEEPATAGKLS